MNKKSIILGKCEIDGGKHTRNIWIYYPLSRRLYIDFDSDYSFMYQIKLKNPDKALAKAKKIVEKFSGKVNPFNLISEGFEFNGPEQYLV